MTREPATTTSQPRRKRVPARERRAALIEAAVEEFARGGLHGTPVERIARRVGVAQPYVFSLFGDKRALFLAAVKRGFTAVEEAFSETAERFDPDRAEPGSDVLKAMGEAYVELLASQRHYLMLQHQAYAACDDEVIREHVRSAYAHLVWHIRQLSGATPERIDEFIRTGMWLNVAAAMRVQEFSSACTWIQEAATGSPG